MVYLIIIQALRHSYFQVGQSLGQPTAQHKTTLSRPLQQEAKLATNQQQQVNFSSIQSKSRVGIASGTKETTSFEGAKPLHATGTDYHRKLSNSSIKVAADVIAQRSTFKDSSRLHSSGHDNNENFSNFRSKSGKNRLSDVIDEEPKPYRPPVKNISDGVISGGMRQRKLWRKSTYGDENDLVDAINSNKQIKRDLIEEERTSARYFSNKYTFMLHVEIGDDFQPKTYCIDADTQV